MPVSRPRPVAFLTLGAAAAALLAVAAVVGVQATLAEASAPFAPSAEAGHIAEGTVVTLDDDVPAIAGLDPSVAAAMREAQTDASADGVVFAITGGWRSARYQQWLLEDAVTRYGSQEEAEKYVATPDRSKHVTGEAVDVGSADAQAWLSRNGSGYGICQTYANEPWHFELATAPGGQCPPMRTDAAS